MQYEVKGFSLSWHPSHHHLSWTRRPQWPSQQLCKPDKSWVQEQFSMIYTFALHFTFLWFFKVVTWEKPRLHHSQWYGFSPVWDRLCLCKNFVHLTFKFVTLELLESFIHLQTRSFEESFPTILAPVCSLVIVLLPVQDGRVSVAELSPTVLALKSIQIWLGLRKYWGVKLFQKVC